MSSEPEYWLNGPVGGVPAYLQPVAHALLQARREVQGMMVGFPLEKLWTKPAGLASVGFHLQHLTGVLDRLFTYAEGKQLNEAQLSDLKLEGVEQTSISVSDLVGAFSKKVDRCIDYLQASHDTDLLAVRGVGRKQIPSTVLGLLFHAAEHTMRHTGQLLVTVHFLKDNKEVG